MTDLLANGLNILLYGRRVGKTRAVLRIAEAGDYVFLASTDHGAVEGYVNRDKYKRHVRIYEIYNFEDMLRALKDAKKTIHEKLEDVPLSKVWFVLDTVTHLQLQLLTEARKAAVGSPGGGVTIEDYVRNVAEYAASDTNFALMSECADLMAALPCNGISVCLEKNESVFNPPAPALNGNAAYRWLGDAHVILRMIETKEGRFFLTSAPEGGGDRFNILSEREKADLGNVQKKIMKAIE